MMELERDKLAISDEKAEIAIEVTMLKCFDMFDFWKPETHELTTSS